MGRRLILDTNILIAYERGTIDRAALDSDELAIAAVTLAEYRVGIELADATAAHHARLLAHTRRIGSRRRAHDLIIAAYAAETGRIVVSGDAKARFNDLPGVFASTV